MRLLRRLSLVTAAMTLALVAIGGLVRATGSGDACPDWPLCHGRLIPPLQLNVLIEWSHRLAVALTGVFLVATAWVAWRRARRDPGLLWPAVGALALYPVQAAIGRWRIVAGPGHDTLIVTLHFVVAMALVALVVVVATNARVRRRGHDAEDVAGRPVRAATAGALAVTAILLLVGAYVRGEGASLAFLDWPLMDGRLIPDVSSDPAAAHFAHRALAAITVVLAALVAARAWRVAHRGVRALAVTALVVLVAQAGLGAAAVLTRLSPAAVAGHVAGSSLAWAALVALAATLRRLRPATARAGEGVEPTTPRARDRVGAYIQLMKPDIIVLLLITTVPAMVLAQGGMPPISLVAATLLGGVLAAGGANAVNCYLDRDIDEIMARTRGRPVPSHRVEPRHALGFGVALVAASFAWLWPAVNVLAAVLALSAAAFYTIVYTGWLKRSTPQNIVIGGAAGAVPVLVGWAAVTGSLSLAAWVLFAIVFYWTPPHFWALALKYAGDYEAARVPMLPVLRGTRETAVTIVLYSFLLIAVSLLLHPVARMGAVYLVAAVVLGGVFVGYAVRLLRDGGSTRAAMALFRYSITYLGLLFAAVAVDQLLRARV